MKTQRKTKQVIRLEREFDQALRERLAARFGATRNDGFLRNMYELKLETKAGTLLVQPNGDWVAMRFLDVDRAKTLLPHRLMEGPLNPYSGKYNSLFLDGIDDVQARVDVVQGMIERVAPC